MCRVNVCIKGLDEEQPFASDPTKTELHLSSNLKSYDRKLARDTCEKLGLSHATTDNGREKHIVIKK